MTHLPLYRQLLSEVGDPGAAATLVLAAALTQSELMTVRETAETLRMGTRSVNRMLASGELPVVKIGRSVRIKRSALLEFLDGRRA